MVRLSRLLRLRHIHSRIAQRLLLEKTLVIGGQRIFYFQDTHYHFIPGRQDHRKRGVCGETGYRCYRRPR